MESVTLDISTACLFLFVPGTRTDRVAKAVQAEPDVVIVDLEDAVAADDKYAARDAVVTLLKATRFPLRLVLRVNAAGTPWHDSDLIAALELPLAAIMLPKSESAAIVRRVNQITNLPIIALIETALGIHKVFEIAEAAERLAFGSIDFAADIWSGHTQNSLAFARSQLVLASRVARIPAPLDGVTTSIKDEDEILRDCRAAVELGLMGKLLIHPAQIAAARIGFSPSSEDVAWALRVVDAGSKQGAITVDGAMVDAPVLARARQILARNRS